MMMRHVDFARAAAVGQGEDGILTYFVAACPPLSHPERISKCLQELWKPPSSIFVCDFFSASSPGIAPVRPRPDSGLHCGAV